MPTVFNFPGKEKDEKVILLLRRHPFILVKQNLLFTLYFAIPIGIYVVAKLWLTFILSFPIYPVLILLISIYYSFFLLFLLVEWIDYYFDVWLVTNKRLIDVDQIGLFKRVIAETRLDKIQDITVEINGPFATLFHYGNIHIQTAAETKRFEIRQVSEPTAIRTTVLKLYDEFTHHLARRVHHPPTPSGVTSEVGDTVTPSPASVGTTAPASYPDNPSDDASVSHTGNLDDHNDPNSSHQ